MAEQGETPARNGHHGGVGVESPERQKQQRSSRMFEMAKASISRAAKHKRGSEDQDPSAGSGGTVPAAATAPRLDTTASTCITFQFAGPAADAEERIMGIFSASQKKHIAGVRQQQGGAASQCSVVTVTFSDKQVACRAAKGFGQHFRLGSDGVSVFGPAAVDQEPAASTGKTAFRVSAATDTATQAAAARNIEGREAATKPKQRNATATAAKKPIPAAHVTLGKTRQEPSLPAGKDKGSSSSVSSSSKRSTKTVAKSVSSSAPTVTSTQFATATSSKKTATPVAETKLGNEGVSIFLGGLSSSCSECELRDAFGELGKHMLELSLKEELRHNKRAGQGPVGKFAYVKFSQRSVGEKALAYWKQVKPLPCKDMRLYSAPTAVSKGLDSNGLDSKGLDSKGLESKEKDAATSRPGSGFDSSNSVRSVTAASGGGPVSLTVKVKADPLAGTLAFPTTVKGQRGVDQTKGSTGFAARKKPQPAATTTGEPKSPSKPNSSAGPPVARNLESRSTSQTTQPAESGGAKKGARQKPTALGNTAATVSTKNTAVTVSTKNTSPISPAKPHSITLTASRYTFDFVVEHFAEKIKEHEEQHQLMFVYLAGKVVIKCLQQQVCMDVQQWMQNVVNEKWIQLRPHEHAHFLSNRTDLHEAMDVPTAQCRGHLLEDSPQLVLVGLSPAVATAWKNIVGFLKRSILLSTLQVEFLLRHSTIAADVADSCSVQLSGLVPGSRRLHLLAVRSADVSAAHSAVRQARGCVEARLNDWHVEKVAVSPVLAKTASRLMKVRQLPVLLAAISQTPSSSDCSYIIAGAPSAPVMHARQLLESQPSSMTLQLPSPPFTPAYVRRLLVQDESLALPSNLSAACLGDVHVALGMTESKQQQWCMLQIQSYVREDIDAVVLFLNKLRESIKEEIEVAPLPSAPSLCLYYLAYIIEYQDGAKKAIMDIEGKLGVEVKSSTTSTPCVTVIGAREACESARQAMFAHPVLLAGLEAKFVSLPTMSMDMVGLLRKRFLDTVEERVGVVCLTFKATEEVTTLLKMTAPPREDSVIIAIFGKPPVSAQQAQTWILSLCPTKINVGMNKVEFFNLNEEMTDWSNVESKHVVQITVNPDNCYITISGLTATDVEDAKLTIHELRVRFAPITEDIVLTYEEELYILHKLTPVWTSQRISFDSGIMSSHDKRVLRLHGRRQLVDATMSSVHESKDGIRSVHITVVFPSQLAKCLGKTWADVVKSSAEKKTVLCLNQDKAFPVSSLTPAMNLDCLPILQLPSSFPRSVIDGQMCFLVIGNDRQEFTEVLQSVRNVGTSVVSQYIVLDQEQREMVQGYFDQDGSHQAGEVFMHMAQKGIHVCAPSREQLSHAKDVVTKWLEKEVTIPLSPIVRKLAQASLDGLQPKLREEFQSEVRWAEGQLVVAGPVHLVAGAADLLFESVFVWEQSICTRSLSIAHWLVPALTESAAIHLLQELEKSNNVVCPSSTDAVAEYQRVVVAEIGAKVQKKEIKLLQMAGKPRAQFVTPPSALVWHMNGLEERSVRDAGQRLSELFAVQLSVLEMTISGAVDARLCDYVAVVAARHLVEITIQQGSPERGRRTKAAICRLAVRGIAPRPANAMRVLQSELSSSSPAT